MNPSFHNDMFPQPLLSTISKFTKLFLNEHYFLRDNFIKLSFVPAPNHYFYANANDFLKEGWLWRSSTSENYRVSLPLWRELPLYLAYGRRDKVHPIKHDRTIHNDNSLCTIFFVTECPTSPCRITLASTILDAPELPLRDGRWLFHVPVITVLLQETEGPLLLWRIQSPILSLVKRGVEGAR
ncbi:hypothetical protein CEXT_129541 [Caerostris extrusa]|uniref:Maturase K n=1 Tax=Caerostris extrusa TaxID=172846 RepID=A0AAV4X2X6_CAEEX|nr:hypothetical protein CEXT_129541 [Caerostris extrusa]